MKNIKYLTDCNKFKAIALKKSYAKNNSFLKQSNKISYSKINLRKISDSYTERNIITNTLSTQNNSNRKHIKAIIGYKIKGKQISITNNERLLQLIRRSLKSNSKKKRNISLTERSKFSNLTPNKKLEILSKTISDSNYNTDNQKSSCKKKRNINIFIDTKSDYELETSFRRYQASFKIIKKSKIKEKNEDSFLIDSIDDIIMNDIRKKRSFDNKKRRNKINEIFKEVQLENNQINEIKKNKTTMCPIKKLKMNLQNKYQNVKIISKRTKKRIITKELLRDEYNRQYYH